MRPTIRFFAAHSHWRGGFFDGDGSIYLSRNSKTNNIQPAIAIAASISEEAVATLGEFQSEYGGKFHTQPARSVNQRPVYYWQISGARIFPVLEDLLANGLCIKRPQAELLLAHRSLFPGRVNQGYGSLDTTKRARLALRDQLLCVRARELSEVKTEDHEARLLVACPDQKTRYAYAAGFCDADGMFYCRDSRNIYYYYGVQVSQKNRPFLEAFKQVILGGAGGNVCTRNDRGRCSSLSIDAQAQVFDFCRNIYPYVVNKSKQVDIILTRPASIDAKNTLESMHGNQNGRSRLRGFATLGLNQQGPCAENHNE